MNRKPGFITWRVIPNTYLICLPIPPCEIITKDAWDGGVNPSRDTGDSKKKVRRSGLEYSDQD